MQAPVESSAVEGASSLPVRDPRSDLSDLRPFVRGEAFNGVPFAGSYIMTLLTMTPLDNSILGVTTVFNLAQLVEEVCDTVCAGHTFRKTHDIYNIAFHDQGSRSRANSSRDENARSSDPLSTDQTKDRVVVTLNVAPFLHWIVRSQPGALRRVVMYVCTALIAMLSLGIPRPSILEAPAVGPLRYCAELAQQISTLRMGTLLTLALGIF